MKLVKLQKDDLYFYKVIFQNDEDLWQLTDFLTDYLIINYDLLLDWLKGKSDWEGVYGEYYGLEEHDGKIYVCRFCDTDEERYSSFNTTKERMIKILTDWRNVAYADPQPNTILITQEGEEVIITAQD